MTYRQQRGMTLLEVLVSMLVIGVAMVGSISMIQASARYTQHANDQSMALYAAQEIIGKIRANPDPDAMDIYMDTTMEAAKSATDCFAKADCADPKKVALSDMKAWWQDIELSLPCPVAQVSFLGDRTAKIPDNQLRLYAVTIYWPSNDNSDSKKMSDYCLLSSSKKIESIEKDKGKDLHLQELVLPFSL